MSDDIDRQLKRTKKIARTIIRLKHSLAADDEIEDFNDKANEALLNGGLPLIDVSLNDITGQS